MVEDLSNELFVSDLSLMTSFHGEHKVNGIKYVCI